MQKGINRNSNTNINVTGNTSQNQNQNQNQNLNYNSNYLNSLKNKNTPSTHRVHNSVTFKSGGKVLQEKETNNTDNLFNFSENVQIDPNHSINLLKKETFGKGNTSNDYSKKNTSKLEIKDLESYENDFINLNKINKRSFTAKHKEDILRKKSLISLYSNSQVGNSAENNQFSYNEKISNNEPSQNQKEDLSNNFCVNEENEENFNLGEKLNLLKNRTLNVLDVYVKKLRMMKNNGTI